MKKAILIKAIKKEGFNKLDLGHHADDVIETLFMNVLNEGRIAVFDHISYLNHTKTFLIRPLIFCREKQIISYCKKAKLPIVNNLCPNNVNTQRNYVKKFIEKNFYQNTTTWPNAYTNIFHCLTNKKQFHLWFLNKDFNF